MKINILVGLAALFLALAVGLGAFGAHALKGRLDPYFLQVYEKAVFYHFIHALAALSLGLFIVARPEYAKLIWIVVLLLASTVIFSGSLYILVLSGVKTWGAITPIGGLGLLLSWLILAVFFLFG